MHRCVLVHPDSAASWQEPQRHAGICRFLGRITSVGLYLFAVFPPDEHISLYCEQFQASLIQAIASSVGASISKVSPDTGKVDWNILDNRLPGLMVQVQGKTVRSQVPEGATWSYPLDIATYNELSRTNIAPTCVRILVVHYIPPSAEEWISSEEIAYQLRSLSFWTMMTGGTPSTNSTTQSVQIRRQDVFCPETLRRLFSELQERGAGS